jgi:serine/threonine protein kinase
LTELEHPNIVQCHGLSKYNDCKLIILEFCHNQNLKLYLRNVAKVPLAKRLEIAAGVVEGLSYLHSKRIGHFDLKPHNILLTSDLVPKICDFGLSERVEDEQTRESKGFTIAY